MSTTPTEYDEKQQRIIDDYREELLSGTTLVYAEQGHRSRRGYKPPISRRDYGHAIKVLGEMAASSDRMCQVASAIVGKLNPYGDRAQLCASVYGAAFQAMKGQYDDVIRRASPEPGRWSDNQHDWTLYDRVAVAYWLAYATKGCVDSVPGVGWCCQAIAREVGFNPTHDMTEAGIN